MSEYINNKEFLAAIKERRELLKNLPEGDPKPKITNYLGDCIMQIATNLAHKGNFSGYSFKEEMISDGIENCIMYFDKFDSDKYSNPFSYYTQIIFFAFLRRIAREKKEFLKKHKIIQSVGEVVLHLQDHDDDQEFVNSYREYLKDFSNVEVPIHERKKREVKEIKSEFATIESLFV